MGVTLASAAAAHAAAGFAVLPLVPGSKHPATRRGLRAATSDADVIRSWWQRIPGANVAVRTGDGILGIDLDTKGSTSGFVELAAHADAEGVDGTAWMDTYTVTTPNRGLHLYYTVDCDVPNRVAVLPGVDVRGQDGYLVAAYSRLGARTYLPESGYREHVSVDDTGRTTLERFRPELAPAPSWLLALVTATKAPPPRTGLALPGDDGHEARIGDLGSYIEAVLLGEADRVTSAEPGTRNRTLNYAAYRLGRHVGAGRLDAGHAEAWLLGVARHMRCDPTRPDPTDSEIRATVRSGLTAGARDG